MDRVREDRMHADRRSVADLGRRSHIAIPRFDLERWLHEYEGRPIRYDLAGSTGPMWTVGEVLALAGMPLAETRDVPVEYSSVEGSPELRSAVADAWGVSANDVQITTGASEALAVLISAHARRPGNVVCPQPGYPSLAALAEVLGMEVRPYRLDREESFALDPGAVVPLVDRDTVVVLLNSPHNPTGACVTPEAVLTLERAARRVGALLVVDQVHHPVTYGPTPLHGLPDGGIVTVGDTSKALSLPGLRVGWIVDRDPWRRRAYFDLRAYFTLSNDPLAERLATIALEHRDRILERTQSVASRNLKELTGFLDRHSHRMDWIRPSGGLTAFPWFTDVRDARPFCQAAAERGVLVVPGDCFGHPAHVRVGFGSNEPDAFGAALAVLDDLMGAWTA